MKLLTEHLERAAHFQDLAEAETDITLNGQLLDRAKAYLKLAAKRAKELVVPPLPSQPEKGRALAAIANMQSNTAAMAIRKIASSANIRATIGRSPSFQPDARRRSQTALAFTLQLGV